MSIGKENRLPNIWFCLLFDLIGMMSYMLPGEGELMDIVWAPISAFLFYQMFGGKIGRIGSVINFLEEILPFTDIIPSFTIAWFIRKHDIEKANRKLI